MEVLKLALSQDVHEFITGDNMLKVDVVALHALPSEVKLYVDVLASIIENDILSQFYCCSVIHPNGWHQNTDTCHLLEHMPEPDYLARHHCTGHVLDFT
jgi:hypothetical protein